MSTHVVFKIEQTGGYLPLMDKSFHIHNLPSVSIFRSVEDLRIYPFSFPSELTLFLSIYSCAEVTT